MDSELDADVARIQALIRKAVDVLAEHTSTVQIFVTLHKPSTDETVSLAGGYGNHFAIRGQVSKWLDELDMPGDDEDEINHLN